MDVVVQHAPQFDGRTAEALAERAFGVVGRAEPLPSERDQNFRVTTADAAAFVLKIANATERAEVLDFENAALDHLAEHAPWLAVPRVCPSLSGGPIVMAAGPDGRGHMVRLLTWVPGRVLAEVRPHTEELLASLGRRAAEANRAFEGFSHPAMTREFPWSLPATPWIAAELHRFADPARRAIVERVLAAFGRDVEPRLARLRAQVIHGDWNDYNALVAPGPAASTSTRRYGHHPHLVHVAGAARSALSPDPSTGSGSSRATARDEATNTLPYSCIEGLRREVVGVVDFGDLVQGPVVADLAVACAYAMLGKPDPLAAAAAVVRGFDEVLPLTDDERAVLLPLIRARLAISVTMAERQSEAAPANEYLLISQEHTWPLLARLDQVDDAWAMAVFRRACGLAASAESADVSAWLSEHRGDFAPLLGFSLRTAPCVVFDLSVGSLDVPTPDIVQRLPEFCAHVDRLMAAAGARVGIGRYDEPRLVYVTELFSHPNNWSDENRTVHLGIDLFCEAGTPVFAPLDGVVHSVANNAAEGDYGPTIVLEHRVSMAPGAAGAAPDGAGAEPVGSDVGRGGAGSGVGPDGVGAAQGGAGAEPGGSGVGPDGVGAAQGGAGAEPGGSGVGRGFSPADLRFFTLYGHLSLESLEGMAPGRHIAKGERFARLGDALVNGGWPPHLHFQVMTSMLGRSGEFPGVAAPGERDIWLSLCPDPNPIVGVPEERMPARSPEPAEVLARRRERIGRNLSISYRRPIAMARGFGQYLYDVDGRRFVDAVNNVAHVGHCHPRVVDAVARQMAVLNTNTRYLHDSLVEYADRLCATMPPGLGVCFLVCSGSEANELALRLARAYTGRRDVVVLDGAYHGNTTSLVEISPYKFNGPGGTGAPEHVHTVAMPDVYRGPYRTGDESLGPRYAREVARTIERVEAAGQNLGTFICESLLGCGGQIVLPDGYLEQAYAAVRAAGGVAIADEVQVGLGRVGTHVWGFETQGVTPDIVTLGKPIGNGFPLGAVVTRPEIADAFANGMEYFNTFGGTQAACAAGLAVLDVMRDEGLQAHALDVGSRLKRHLRSLMDDFPIVGDVRGLGLFLGVELVADRSTLEPAARQADYVVNRLRDRGVLVSTDGPLHNVLKIKPPMPFSADDADRVASLLREILAEDPAQP